MIVLCFVHYPGSLEMHSSTYISTKLKILTYTYKPLQFPVERNTRGSITLTTFIPFHTKYDLQGQIFDYESLIFVNSSHNSMLRPHTDFNVLRQWKTGTFEH